MTHSFLERIGQPGGSSHHREESVSLCMMLHLFSKKSQARFVALPVGEKSRLAELVSHHGSDPRGVLRRVVGHNEDNSRVKRAWDGVVKGWVTYQEVICDTLRVKPKHRERSCGDCRVRKQ
ncbi:hypothetical protein YC2023_099451 [Brassica napus]